MEEGVRRAEQEFSGSKLLRRDLQGALVIQARIGKEKNAKITKYVCVNGQKLNYYTLII